MDERVANVVALIEKQPDISIRTLAVAVHLSPSRLRSLFRADIGSPLRQYLKQQRLAHAHRLLAGTFLSIKEIAVLMGYKDSSHFVRDFHRTFAMPPAAYRRAGVSSHK